MRIRVGETKMRAIASVRESTAGFEMALDQSVSIRAQPGAPLSFVCVCVREREAEREAEREVQRGRE